MYKPSESDVENDSRNADATPAMQSSKKKGMYLDDAISKIEFGLFNNILIFVSGMVMAALIMETVGITFVLPVSQCDLNLTTSEKGLLGAAGFFGIICSSHLWGFLADTQGRRCVIQPTLLLALLISVISSFVQSFYLLATLRFFNGFFISGSSATIYVYLSEFHNNSQRSRAIMGSSVIFGMSCILMPLIAWGVINQEWQFNIPIIDVTYKPWRLFLVVCSLPSLTSFVIFMFLPESPKFVLSQGKQAEVCQILHQMNRMNNGNDSLLELSEIYEETESIENRQKMLENKNHQSSLLSSVWNQTVPLFQPPHLVPTVLICLIQFSIFFTSQGFNVFFVDILNKMAANIQNLAEDEMMMCDVISMKPLQFNETYDNENVKVCISKLELTILRQGVILQVLYAGGFLLVTLLINRISKFPIIFTILVGTGACGIACMLTNIPLLQMCLFTIFMASGVGSNVLNTATVELYPTNLRAMAICISLMFGRLGSMTGSNVVAFLLDNYCGTAFYVSGISLIAGGVLTFFIPNIHEKVTKCEKNVGMRLEPAEKI